MIFEPDNEGNGEICFKGRNRFMGYYKDDIETMKAIDSDGYMHSGLSNSLKIIYYILFKKIIK